MTHPVDLHGDIGEILLTEDQIQAKVRELGARITADYAGRQLTLVSVLKGSLPFMADLMRAIDLPVRIDLMEVSSYGGTTTESSGLVRILKDLSASIADEDVLIVEDIIDTGLTLNYLIRYLRGKNPATPAHLHAPRQAGPAAGRDPGRLSRLRDPGPVRRRVRAGLRRAVPEPAHRRRPSAGGLLGGPRRVTMHRRPLGRGRTLAAVAGVLLVVGCVLPWWKIGGGETGHHARSRATGSRAAASSSSSSASRRSRWSPCRTRPATGRWRSIAGCRTCS